MTRILLIGGLILAGWLNPAGAAERTLTLDPAATDVSFILESSLHAVHGTMALDEGVIVFDDEAGTASGRVVINAVSAETGKKKRDKKLHRRVLETETYPEIVFVPSGIEHRLVDEGSGPIVLTGTVTVHGSDHPVRLEATVNRDGDSVTAAFDLPIPFVEWGMHDPSVFVFRTEKVVLVHVDVDGTLEVTP